MRKIMVITGLAATITCLVSFSGTKGSLRDIYSRPPEQWPSPRVDKGVHWIELGIVPGSPIEQQKDSLKHIIELGKTLFFDPRLSASGKISCATCHQPELNWTDGKERSVGHEGAMNKRNSPTIHNTWFYQRLFWDGRAKDLQDQAFAPIISESEMGSDMPEVMIKLRSIKGYRELFKKAYGDEQIDPDRMTNAISIFEKSIVSGKSRFDEFLEGKRKALSKEELRGLHVFRTKAQCMNCHNGPLFTDNQFHNNGFHQNGDPGNDKGHYKVTHKDADIGKFKTPSLRDVVYTGPWMHNGMMKTLNEVLSHYNKGAAANGRADSLVKMLFLTNKELADLRAFLGSISAAPVAFPKPVIPE